MSGSHYETTNSNFLRRLVAEAPALNFVLIHHLALYDELLSHLFMADIARWAESVANSVEGGTEDLSSTLNLLDIGWIEGGHSVQEMIADSFLENLTMSGRLWDLLPKDLRTAAQRIHDTQPRSDEPVE